MSRDRLARYSTFSLIGYDPETNRIGVGVQSKFFAVGASVPWVKPGVGAIATQAYTNLAYGVEGLARLERRFSVYEIMHDLLVKDPEPEKRQVAIMDSSGKSAVHTGEKAPKVAGQLQGENFVCQGNLLADSHVIEKMAEEFEEHDGRLSRRLLSALQAGQGAGGDRRGQQSAALIVLTNDAVDAGSLNDRVDIRVDDHPEPIEELDRLLGLHELYFDPRGRREYVRVEENDLIIIQDALRRLDLYGGKLDGQLSEETLESLKRFLWGENLGKAAKVTKSGELSVDKRLFDYLAALLDRSPR